MPRAKEHILVPFINQIRLTNPPLAPPRRGTPIRAWLGWLPCSEGLGGSCAKVNEELEQGAPVVQTHFDPRNGIRPKCNTSQTGTANAAMASSRPHVHAR